MLAVHMGWTSWQFVSNPRYYVQVNFLTSVMISVMIQPFTFDLLCKYCTQGSKPTRYLQRAPYFHQWIQSKQPAWHEVNKTRHPNNHSDIEWAHNFFYQDSLLISVITQLGAKNVRWLWGQLHMHMHKSGQSIIIWWCWWILRCGSWW